MHVGPELGRLPFCYLLRQKNVERRTRVTVPNNLLDVEFIGGSAETLGRDSPEKSLDCGELYFS